MASSGYLVPPEQDPSKKEFWTETWKRIDRFLPELRTDLALDTPGAKAPEEKPAATATVEEAAASAEGEKAKTEAEAAEEGA
jgi:brefeldin A-resistance guanine nucleotide exchange factor 1